jgi:hypothetical protein
VEEAPAEEASKEKKTLTKAQKKKLNDKKNKLIAQITGEISEAGEVTEEKSAEVAK